TPNDLMRMSRHAARLSFDTKLNSMVPLTWIEHVASPLPRECSTTERQGHRVVRCPRKRTRSTKTGAGEGNRTLVVSLEGFCSTIELHPRRRLFSHAIPLHTFPCGGEGWIRTSVLVRGQIYSLLPLTTRPPLRREPQAMYGRPIFVNAENECPPGNLLTS